jgi:hypothetical protein
MILVERPFVLELLIESACRNQSGFSVDDMTGDIQPAGKVLYFAIPYPFALPLDPPFNADNLLCARRKRQTGVFVPVIRNDYIVIEKRHPFSRGFLNAPVAGNGHAPVMRKFMMHRSIPLAQGAVCIGVFDAGSVIDDMDIHRFVFACLSANTAQALLQGMRTVPRWNYD